MGNPNLTSVVTCKPTGIPTHGSAHERSSSQVMTPFIFIYSLACRRVSAMARTYRIDQFATDNPCSAARRAPSSEINSRLRRQVAGRVPGLLARMRCLIYDPGCENL